MSNEIRDELLAISRDLEEQLKFYREIGVEDIGGSTFATEPAPGADSTPPAGLYITSAGSASHPQTQPADAKPRAEAYVEQTGLFGDIVLPRGQTGSRSRGALLPTLEFSDASLEAIREDLGDCRRCNLCEHRKTIVFGEGNPHARLVFVGEGPGAEEDATGRPFVGRAGQLLDKIIEAIGLKREEVYIANIVKCRPPGNRVPERDEVETCEPFLFRQLACIRPQVIVALGSPAFQCLLRTREPITRARGVWRDWNGIKVMPTFHPAFLLRSPDKKREVWEDMKKVREELKTEK
jgi:uracil-DNA glycosylase family 4